MTTICPNFAYCRRRCRCHCRRSAYCDIAWQRVYCRRCCNQKRRRRWSEVGQITRYPFYRERPLKCEEVWKRRKDCRLTIDCDCCRRFSQGGAVLICPARRRRARDGEGVGTAPCLRDRLGIRCGPASRLCDIESGRTHAGRVP